MNTNPTPDALAEQSSERSLPIELREAANLLEISGDFDLRDACREAADSLEASHAKPDGATVEPIADGKYRLSITTDGDVTDIYEGPAKLILRTAFSSKTPVHLAALQSPPPVVEEGRREAASEVVARALCRHFGEDPDAITQAGNQIGEAADYPLWMLYLPEARPIADAILALTPATAQGDVREALEPFAAKARQFTEQPDGMVTIQMDFAHFQRAATTLATLKGQDNG